MRQGALFAGSAKEEVVGAGALLSPCDKYRYFLWRTWREDIAPITFCLINPSTADSKEDDPTLRKCMTYAREWGFGGVQIVNLFAYRTKSPKVLAEAAKRGEDIVGPENDGNLRLVLQAPGVVLCGWGNMPSTHVKRTSLALSNLFGAPGAQLCCLGVNLDGSPKHPLYLRGDLQPQPYDLRDTLPKESNVLK